MRTVGAPFITKAPGQKSFFSSDNFITIIRLKPDFPFVHL